MEAGLTHDEEVEVAEVAEEAEVAEVTCPPWGV